MVHQSEIKSNSIALKDLMWLFYRDVKFDQIFLTHEMDNDFYDNAAQVNARP